MTHTSEDVIAAHLLVSLMYYYNQPHIKTKPALPRKNHQAQSKPPTNHRGEFICTRGCGRVFHHAPASIAHSKSCRCCSWTRDELVSIYEQHNPMKVAEIDHMLSRYEGRELLLLAAVKAKYLA